MKKVSSCCLMLMVVLAAQFEVNLAAPAPTPSPEDAKVADPNSEKACAQLCNMKDEQSKPLFSKIDECNSGCLKQAAKEQFTPAVPLVSEAAGFATTDTASTDPIFIAKDCVYICTNLQTSFLNPDPAVVEACKASCTASAASLAVEDMPAAAPAPAPSGSVQMTYGLASMCVVLSMALFI